MDTHTEATSSNLWFPVVGISWILLCNTRIFHMGMEINFGLPGLIPTFKLLVLCQSCRKLLPHCFSADLVHLCYAAEPTEELYFPSENISSNCKTNCVFLTAAMPKSVFCCCCWKNLEGGSLWKGLERRESQLGCWPQDVLHSPPWVQPACRWSGRCPMGCASTRLSHWLKCHCSHPWCAQDPTWRPTGREEQINHFKACKSCSSVCTQEERGGLTTPGIVQLPKPLRYWHAAPIYVLPERTIIYFYQPSVFQTWHRRFQFCWSAPCIQANISCSGSFPVAYRNCERSDKDLLGSRKTDAGGCLAEERHTWFNHRPHSPPPKRVSVRAWPRWNRGGALCLCDTKQKSWW